MNPKSGQGEGIDPLLLLCNKNTLERSCANQVFRIALCEDDPHDARNLAALLGRYAQARPSLQMQVQSFSSGDEMLRHVARDPAFDLYLMDILMPEQDGITAARELRARYVNAPLVFLTSSTDHALAAFGVQATQYLLKPVQEDTLFPVLDRLLEVRHAANDYFIVSLPDRKVRVSYSSILFVESFRRTLLFYLADGEMLTSKTIRVPIHEAVAPLLEDARFLHVHKSYILNMAHVQELTSSSFVMANGSELPIPRYKYADAKARYLAYLSACDIGLLGG